MFSLSIPGIRIQNQSGNRVYCYCPFHKGGKERSASMVIYLDAGTWKCHACSPEKKSVLELLQRLGLNPVEARNRLAVLRRFAVEEVRRPATGLSCPEALLGQFLGQRPRPLIEAGFTREVLDEMEVGLDEVRFRAIYPVRDPKGTFLGVVGGALFKKGTQEYAIHYGFEKKYLAYGPRQGFPFQVNPKSTCWNLHRVARSTVRQPVVVVEGFKALMAVRMTGWTNVVATGGAGVEDSQVELLAGLGGPYLIFLDNDDTGIPATRVLQRKLRRQKNGVGVVRYPRPVLQPDDLTPDEIKLCLGART